MAKVRIEIETSTLQALQGIARPLVDNYDTVITRLLGQYQRQNVENTRAARPASAPLVQPGHFAGDNPPSLAHTRIIRARIDGHILPRANWNKVLWTLYDMAAREHDDLSFLKGLSTARIVPGVKTGNGYKPVADGVISLQGVNANEAWRHIADCAGKLGKQVSIRFEWRNKKAAAYPGKTGVLSWPETGADPYLHSIAASLNEWSDAEDAQAYDGL